MADQRRRLASYLGIVLLVILGYTVAYRWGMATLEGHERTVVESLQVVVETFTTTGYGEDAGFWSTSTMQLLMIAMQLTGVTVIFLTLPLFVAPWVEQRLETTVPSAVEGYTDHVVLCELTARGETLIDELDSWDREHVIVEPERDRAAGSRSSTAIPCRSRPSVAPASGPRTRSSPTGTTRPTRPSPSPPGR